MRRSRTQSAARLVLALALAGPALALQDPFSPGERWEASAAAGKTPWTPEDVALAGDAAFVWIGLRGGDHALELYDGVASGNQMPRGVVTRQADETTVPVVAAGSRGDRVFALRQSASVSVFRRIPVVFAYDPLQAGQLQSPAGPAPARPLRCLDPRVLPSGPSRHGSRASGGTALLGPSPSGAFNVRLRLARNDGG